PAYYVEHLHRHRLTHSLSERERHRHRDTHREKTRVRKTKGIELVTRTVIESHQTHIANIDTGVSGTIARRITRVRLRLRVGISNPRVTFRASMVCWAELPIEGNVALIRGIDSMVEIGVSSSNIR